jgi:hypothetical protein
VENFRAWHCHGKHCHILCQKDFKAEIKEDGSKMSVRHDFVSIFLVDSYVTPMRRERGACTGKLLIGKFNLC